MTIKRKLTSLTAAVALAATTLAPMATSASAEPWHKGTYSGIYAHSYHGGDVYRGNGDNWNRGHHDDGPRYRNFDRRHHDHGDHYAYRRHKHHDTGKYIALGIGALMLGIMASEAGRY